MTRLTALSLLLWVSLAAAASTGLEEVARLDAPPGNITVTPEGRVILSMHQFFEPRWRVTELMPDGTLRPFPNQTWASGRSDDIGLDAVLGIQSDGQGVVWMLDNGLRSGQVPRLVAWNSRTDALSRIIPLDGDAVAATSFVNDLAVDESSGTIYIADPARGDQAALIVVDLAEGSARRVLQGHPSLVGQDVPLRIDGKPVRIRQPDGSVIEPRVGVNPIALDHDNQWLYFGPMHSTELFRIRTRDLRDPALSDEMLGSRVMSYAARPVSDGISIDEAGNIYITDVAHNAVGVIGADRGYRRLYSDATLSWPDAFSYGPDGMMYTVANQLQRSAALNAGKNTASPPYYVYRFPPLAPGRVGQ